MADLKISALTGATTPLAGTEVLPIVQGGSTVKVAVSNLTAGRAVSAASLALTTTPLPASSGGTGLTAVTAGYIPFGNSATALNTDAGLFWDNSNKRLGLGTTSPGTLVDVNFASAGGAMRIRNTQTDGFADVRVGNNTEANLGFLRVGGSTIGNIYQNTFTMATGGGYNIVIAPQGVSTMVFDPSANATLTSGNLVIGTSGKGIDFSATPGTGTSELFSDYEEGTWTPVGNGITYATASGRYTKIGRLVYLDFYITFPVTANVSSASMSGIPFSNGSGSFGGGGFRYTDINQYLAMAAGITDITFFTLAGNNITNATLSTKIIQGFVVYTV